MSGIPEIKTEHSENFKRIIVGGIVGAIAPAGLEATIYSEQRDMLKALETEPLSANRITIKRTVECDLLISPLSMISIYSWLGGKIKEYEKTFGRISSPEEIQSRQQRKDDQQ